MSCVNDIFDDDLLQDVEENPHDYPLTDAGVSEYLENLRFRKKCKVDFSNMVERRIASAEPHVGEVEEWEVDMISNFSASVLYCIELACVQTSASRAVQWLQAHWVLYPYDRDIVLMAQAVLIYGCSLDRKEKRDEAALMMSQVKSKQWSNCVDKFDPNGSGARRVLVNTLLNGHHEKNEDTALHRSFFHSSMREILLLPLISTYLVPERQVEESKIEEVTSTKAEVSCLRHIPSLVFNDNSSVSRLLVHILKNDQYACFFPALLSSMKSLKEILIRGGEETISVDLSGFEHINKRCLAKLEILTLLHCSVCDLESLAECDFSSLQTLRIGGEMYNIVMELCSLEGLPMHTMSSIEEIYLACNDLEDISAFSHADLSNLKVLKFQQCISFSDLSPLRHSDLSSLKQLTVSICRVSDISPLCECKGLQLEELDMSGSMIEDLTPFSSLDLSELTEPINLRDTYVRDLSPLEDISFVDVVVNISETPAERSLKERGFRSPHCIGNVTVVWD